MRLLGLAMWDVMAGDGLAKAAFGRLVFRLVRLAMAFGQSPARAFFQPNFASNWRFRQLSETLGLLVELPRWRLPVAAWRRHAPLGWQLGATCLNRAYEATAKILGEGSSSMPSCSGGSSPALPHMGCPPCSPLGTGP